MESCMCWLRRAKDKLGGCTYCMRRSAAGMAASWLVVLAAAVLWPAPVIVALATVVAAAFTLLTFAHGSAFVIRMMRRLKSVSVEGGDGEVRLHFAGRRQMLLTVGRLTAAAFLGKAMWPKTMLYAQQQVECAGEHAVVPPAGDLKLSTCVNAKNRNKEQTAENQTVGAAKKAAEKFADGFCNRLDLCPEKKACKRKGAGYKLKLLGCVLDPMVQCDKHSVGFVCTWQVTAVECRCG